MLQVLDFLREPVMRNFPGSTFIEVAASTSALQTLLEFSSLAVPSFVLYSCLDYPKFCDIMDVGRPSMHTNFAAIVSL